MNEFIQLLETKRFSIASETEMQNFGSRLVKSLPEKALVTLSGELGAGKSVLARAMIHALGYEGRVKSPTYTLIETYEASHAGQSATRIAHLDLYRLSDPEELEYLGFDDVLANNNLVIIEWPEQGEGRVPAANLNVSIEYADTDSLMESGSGSGTRTVTLQSTLHH
ncbi:tRNA (adenosine(37)-N6)-threonylcarbamoyltransferase complex ATPase subunit type 1 TsaE [Granulosicoccus sp.]|nr:tRNA (adenosine(37)-N6)-threonylcarbamoyltransferase complex ATPase subunit type 1 TsaE [Granulosicoccus sp.]MDB4223925.1 tRNA (adenosine(37)-N6)-threonylcarbamoyltransferase complex ATPase subunit type 1 TsaE [Granulosicoccus sp.]